LLCRRLAGALSRLEREYSPIFAPPEVTGHDLTRPAGPARGPALGERPACPLSARPPPPGYWR